mgnify:FL=1
MQAENKALFGLANSLKRGVSATEQEIMKKVVPENGQEGLTKQKKAIIPVITFLCTVIIAYMGMSIYFINHFYFGTVINGVNISGKSLKETEAIMASNLQNYRLSLIERKGIIEYIKAEDIGLQYSLNDALRKIKDSQKPFKWIFKCFHHAGYDIKVDLTFNEELLKQRMDRLYCFHEEHIEEPENPGFLYIDNEYVIIDGSPGNKVDKDILYSRVSDCILNGKTEIDLEAEDCYIKAPYHSDSREVIAAKELLNKYVSSRITYIFGDKHEVVDGVIINTWLTVDNDYQVGIDEEKVRNYINELSNRYCTVGKTRNFVTSSGEIIKIGKGDYGWAINRTEEVQYLISAIQEGATIIKEPSYEQTAFAWGGNDIGNSYVEIDLSKQHIWFYKNGTLIVHGDIVTGNVKKNHATPRGIYRLKYKTRNVVLRGPSYAVPVSFWMPFNGGIGIHDASWRSKFGGEIYKTDGSHGCINCPYNVAKEIYHHITPGTPIICY